METNVSLGDRDNPNLVGPNQTQFDYWATEVANALYLYYTPALVLLGSIGNLASVFVFYNSKLRLQSTSQYLSALAVSDEVFLLQLIPPWLSASQITSIFYRGGFCQVIMYISYVSCGVSAWLVVVFTVERFVAVIYPLRLNSVCTITRARLVIVALVITSSVVNSPVLRFTAANNGVCSVDKDYLVEAARFNIADTILSFTVPLLAIIFLNSWITVGVCQLERARHQLMKVGRRELEPPRRNARQPSCPRSQQKVTRMLLTVSSVYVLLNLPAYMIRVFAYASDMHAETVGGRWTALQQIALLFFHTNFGINFILYCLSGQNFRQALVQALPWVRRQARREISVRRTVPAAAAQAGSISASFASTIEVNTVSAIATAAQSERSRPERFIRRWRFDNRERQRDKRRAEEPANVSVEVIPMRTFGIRRYLNRSTPCIRKTRF